MATLKEVSVFTLSAKGVYGLTAVLELGMRYQAGAVQIREIAERYDIPQHYLEQILVALRRAGLVHSIRGAAGGYMLSRPPSQVLVQDVLTTLEGRLAVVPEAHKENALAFFWSELHRELAALLDRTVEDLIIGKQQAEARYMYSI